jgi:glutamate racemase
MNTSGKIGFFDSGIGGLTSLAAVRHALPQYDYVYLGDTARAPYGARGQDEIYTFTKEAISFLQKEGCVFVIVACNTASAEALKRIQIELAPVRDTFRVLGILAPLVEIALEHSKTKRIGVLATQSTVTSGAYTREIMKRAPAAFVQEVACPLLVPLIESGEVHGDKISSTIETYLTPLLTARVDSVILGCTHYGHIANTIRALLPEHTALIYEEHCIGPKTKAYLEKHTEIERALTKNGTLTVYTTKQTEMFSTTTHDLFGVDATEATFAR